MQLYDGAVMYPSLIMIFGTSKNSNCLLLVPASILEKYVFQQCSLSMVFSLFLGTAYMLLCNNGIATHRHI